MTTFAENYIGECKAALHDNPHRIRSVGLALAVTEAEMARQRLLGVQARLTDAVAAIDKVLAVPGVPLAGHEFGGENYGKLGTLAAAAGFKQAMINLVQERDRFDGAKQEHRDCLRGWAEEGRGHVPAEHLELA